MSSTRKDKESGLPQKYVPKSLSPAQKRKQIESIRKGTDRPKLKGIRTRRSPYTIKALNYFGEGNTSKEDMARILARGNRGHGNRKREMELKEGFDKI